MPAQVSIKPRITILILIQYNTQRGDRGRGLLKMAAQKGSFLFTLSLLRVLQLRQLPWPGFPGNYLKVTACKPGTVFQATTESTGQKPPLATWPRGVSEDNVPFLGPARKDGLLCDETMPTAWSSFVGQVHLAFIQLALLKVVVRHGRLALVSDKK